MRTISIILVILAVLAIIIGAISRITFTPIGQIQLSARAFYAFAQTILLLAIALLILEKK